MAENQNSANGRPSAGSDDDKRYVFDALKSLERGSKKFRRRLHALAIDLDVSIPTIENWFAAEAQKKAS